MKERQMIRIFIEADKAHLPRAQEAVIRAMFQRYFARDSYWAALSMVFCQMIACFACFWRGLPASTIVLTVLLTGVGQALLRGLILWASNPPPPPPPVQSDSAEPPP